MKHAYPWARPLLAALFSFIALGASAQQAWRPFRPGLIYTYQEAAGASTSLYTLRVDSAYAAANGDSVYTFNRRMREATVTLPGVWSMKSRNNLFGAQMRWRPGQNGYTLEALAQPNVQTAVSLELFPRAAVGSTWNASSQPLRTATLVSRGLQIISPGVQDTVAVISVTSAGATTTVRLSRRYGLLAGPQWLGGATGNPLTQAQLPASFVNSLYSPLRLFDVQPGDEFGYQEYDMGMSPIRCYDNQMLRRVLSKRLTADSLIISYQEQRRYQDFGYSGYCAATARITYSAIMVRWWRLALTGNQWPAVAGDDTQLAALRLLTGEYVQGTVPGAGGLSYVLTGRPISSAGATNCPSSTVSFAPYYVQTNSNPPVYRTGVDYAAWQYGFGPGATTTIEGPSFMSQIYSRRTVNGTTQTCGTPMTFVLSTHAAQAAAIASLHPNPAAVAATLTLATPARPGTTLRLTDALGRAVWAAPVPAGQSAVTVPLAGQPAGLYLLHLTGPDGANATWKLTHE